jgi:hypothetical protein
MTGTADPFDSIRRSNRSNTNAVWEDTTCYEGSSEP